MLYSHSGVFVVVGLPLLDAARRLAHITLSFREQRPLPVEAPIPHGLHC